MNQIGCATITYRMLDRATALQWIAADGFKTIDLGVITKFCPHADPVNAAADDHKRLADEIASHGLTVSTCNVWSLTALNGPDGRDVEFNYVKDSLRMAAALGCYAISMQPGRKAEAAQWDEQAKFVAGCVNELAAYARDLGIKLTVEAPHKGTLVEGFDQAITFLDLVNSDLVGVALDTSHILNGGSTIEHALDVYGSRVRHVHLRDYKDGNILVTPGDGDVDFGKFFQRMKALNYARDFNVELEYKDSTPEQNRAQLQRAAKHLRSLL